MSRAAGVVVVLAVVVVVAVAVLVPHLKARVVSTGTPVPQPLYVLSLFPVSQRATCLDQVAVEPGSQVARVDVRTPALGPALRFTIRGDAYRQVYDVPAGYISGPVMVPFEGPRQSMFTQVCVRNLGRADVQLVGTNEPRTLSRPHMTIDGTPTAGEFSLAFASANGVTKFALVGKVARRMAAFKPIWVQPALVVVLLALVLLGAFVVPLLALWKSFASDEQDVSSSGA